MKLGPEEKEYGLPFWSGKCEASWLLALSFTPCR